MKELAKTYDPQEMEPRIYENWLKKGYFHANVNSDKKPFSVMMPPPNVTGQLHMGHALDNTLQDSICRFKRMQGYEVLWQPGTDHAAIATEVKVINKLKSEGKDKHELGREGFLKEAWAWKEEYESRILKQMYKMGAGADWERKRFTMDEGCSEAVKKVFIDLYNKGYIYKGNRIINWCPVCKTSISDAEVIFNDGDRFIGKDRLCEFQVDDARIFQDRLEEELIERSFQLTYIAGKLRCDEIEHFIFDHDRLVSSFDLLFQDRLGRFKFR